MSFDATGWLNQLYSVPPNTPGGPGAVDAYGKNVAAAAALGAGEAGRAGLGMINDYNNMYRPYDQKIMRFADEVSTDSYREGRRGSAMAGVQQQYSNALSAQNQQMAAMGINPNSARFRNVNAASASQLASAKIQAALGADANSYKTMLDAYGTISSTGLKVGELGNKTVAMAGDLAKVGLLGSDLGASAYDRNTNAQANMTSAGAAATGAAAAMQNAGTSATRAANDFTLGKGKIASDIYNIDKNYDLANRGLQLKADAGSFGNTFGNMLMGAGGNWLQNGGFNTIGNAFTNWRVSQPGSDTSTVPNWNTNVTMPDNGGGYGVNAPTDLDVPGDSDGFDYFFA